MATPSTSPAILAQPVQTRSCEHCGQALTGYHIAGGLLQRDEAVCSSECYDLLIFGEIREREEPSPRRR